jgi:alpha-beta hydrolase superfamily lysophospholipase
MFVAAAAALLLLAGCTARIDERSLVHSVRAGALDAAELAKAAPRYAAEQHWIEGPDGVRLHAALLRQPGAKATILYFGGNGYTIGHFAPWTASTFMRLGVNLLIVDHRGYGLSTGTASMATAEGDALVAFDHLQRLTPQPILVHGHSMGSFMAGHVAANRDTAGAILESSVTTTEDWVASQTGGITGKLVRVKVDPALSGRGNLGNVSRIEEPLLIIVGGKDKTTPPVLSQRLYDASPLPAGRKQLVVVSEANHNDVMIAKTVHAAYARLLGEVTGSSPSLE